MRIEGKLQRHKILTNFENCHGGTEHIKETRYLSRSATVSRFFFTQENSVMLQLAMREQYKKNQERLDTIRWHFI